MGQESEYEVRNLLANTADIHKTLTENWEPFDVSIAKDLDFGADYSLSFECESTADSSVQVRFIYISTDGKYKPLSDTPSSHVSTGENHVMLRIPAFSRPDDFASAYLMIQAMAIADDGAQLTISRPMLVEGTTPAAWAPAEGESLPGGGAQMSANLLEGIEPTLDYPNISTVNKDGSITSGELGTAGWYDVARWKTTLDPVSENQTLHLAASFRWHAAAATQGTLYVSIRYADAAGNTNGIDVEVTGLSSEWQRVEGTVVLPSGMHVVNFHVSARQLDAAYDVTAPTLSYGTSGPILASDSHTPYATQDHVKAVYATNVDLKLWEDAITSEVSERTKLSGRVGTLESTSSEHTTKITQLSSSIESMVKGEATYTAPDGTTQTNGLYSKIEQTADGINETFGQYTKTSDLASTDAVRDAKKAGTDAASAASAAQSTADTAKANAATAQTTANTAVTNASTAQSTADAAKTAAANAQSTANTANTTANNLATLIHRGDDGVTVGYSADGTTFTGGRTRQGTNSFDVLDANGNTTASLAKDQVSLLGGLAKLTATQETTTTEQSGTLSYDVLKINSQYEMLLADHRANISAECSGANTSGVATNSTAGITVMSYDDTSKTVGASLMGYVSDTDTTDWSLNSASFQLTPDEFNVQVDAVTTSKDLKVGGVAQLPGGLAVGGGSKIVCVYYGTDTPKLSGTSTAWMASSAFKAKTGVDPSQTKCAVFVSNGDWDSYIGNLTAGYQPSTKCWNLYADRGVSGQQIRINYMIVVWE